MLAFGLLALLLGVEAKAADLTGTEVSSFTRPSGEKVEVIQKLKQNGDRLTGTHLG
jgi:hypothetical protein